MKKKIFLLSLISFFGVMNAQRVQKGEAQMNVGIGLANGWGMPVYAGVDYGVHKDITVGVEGSFSTEKYSGDVKGRWLSVGLNGNYHFNTLLKIPNKFDVYAGVTLAYNSFSYRYKGSDYDYLGGESSGVGFAGQAGARYYFTDHFAVNVEVGGGSVASGGKAGISYKF
ncbi:porin family protein [Chryseobacterium herbae]|uniref:Porin family protein n=1 Tax=Chryseobacterium herbae TaxID=2976476 RepID=A0ABT2IQC4_9FLAO|nr:porin family protein [Chryseobacterium sp. pc1-10]MCT2561016.1 porin family protein [Chryseobacterium sp. pc1-10]